jgi:hypothetical protein
VEQGLCSKGSEFLALSRNFICVRLYYTARGASEPFARLGLGNPGGPRNNVDLAFIAPDGRNIDVRTLKPVQGPQDGVWVRDIVSSQKNEAGDGRQILEKTYELMKAITKQYPGKAGPAAVPWQVSLSHGVFVSAWDSKVRSRRRMVVVPTESAAAELLGDADLLRKFERQYVFVKVSPKEAPSELQESLERAGANGIVILDAAQSVNGFGQKQESLFKVYPVVLEAKAGPLTRQSVAALLEKHGLRS